MKTKGINNCITPLKTKRRTAQKKIPFFVLFCFSLLLAINLPNASADINDGLMAYYPFDGSAIDISGNDNNGEESGDLQYAKGIKGDSASFDGIDDFIRVPSAPSLNPIDQLSISFWVKVEGYTNDWSPIVHKGGPALTGVSNREYSVWLNKNANIYFGSAGDNSAQYPATIACCVKVDGWTHFVTTIDRQNHISKIYMDGMLLTEVNDSYSSFNNNDNDLIIGWSEEIQSTYSLFKGRIDELRIHKRILSKEEIDALFNEGATLSADLSNGLVAYYPFNGSANDESSNDNNGVAINGVEPAPDRFSKPNSAYNFDGINDFITIPYIQNIEPSFFTISVWVKTTQNSWGTIITSDPDGFLCSHGYVIEINPLYSDNKLLVFGVDRSANCGDGNGVSTPSTNINDGKWHHIVAIYDQRLRLYLDNIFISSFTNPSYKKTHAPIRIGMRPMSRGVKDSYFDGIIDDIRIYNRNLSSTEITMLFQEGGYVNNLNFIGDTISIPQKLEFSLEQQERINISIRLQNLSNNSQSASLEVINPHSALTVSTTALPSIIFEPREVRNILININAGEIPTGIYDDILLKLSVENGETLYSNITATIIEQGTGNLPDLNITAQDIQLSDYTLGESTTLEAVVHNNGLTSATNVQVKFYEFGSLIGETTLDEVPAESFITATLTAPIASSGEHLIRVVVDPENTVDELSENNNEASQIIKIGTSSPIPGSLLVSGSLPGSVYTNELFTISGQAAYDIVVEGVRYTNYVVKGGSVQITITGDAGQDWLYGNIHTDINGYFSKTVQAPSATGNYHVSMTVSDASLSGHRDLFVAVNARPATPPPPPLPPANGPYIPYGPGNWEPSSDGTAWNWVPVGPQAPSLDSDLFVFSENIHFSSFNPELGDEVTIFSELKYWATNTSLIAESVPVNFYVTYPGSPKMKFGETLIDSLSVDAPDFGSRYVYSSWKNQHEGIHLVEVEIDPDYIEDNRINNAATRAIIVGELESLHGAIAGQVTNTWGGVANVVIELYDAAGNSLLEQQVTSDTGFYLFESLVVDNFQVRIIKPENHQVDAEIKPAEVIDQSITEVDFYLTQQEQPVAECNGPYAGIVGDQLILDASGSYDPDGQIVAYEWDYDNDGIYDLTSVSPTITYTLPTKYNGIISLRVTDNDGLAATDTAVLVISGSSVALCGDLDADNDVDGDDRNILRSALNTRIGQETFIPEADYDEDGLISYNDYREWYVCYKAFITP